MKPQKNNPIDFVIIWVDGNDPDWQAERLKYTQNTGDNREIRYRDWGTLKYWFRGVEKYAPWVNHIYFVTWGHVPSWLDASNPKISIINHKDFIPKKYLPTFSSHVIELNLHRIKGLSEHFVYFNDDMFLANSVTPLDFFKNGIPCDSAILSPAIKESRNGIGNIELNNQAIINENFDKNTQIKQAPTKWFNIRYQPSEQLKNILLMPWNSFTSFYEYHIPNSFLKSTYQEIWDIAITELEQTCQHKFRDLKQDLNQWLIRDWQLASNNFIPRKTNFGKLFTLNNDSNISEIFHQAKKYKTICINDSETISPELFASQKAAMLHNFQSILPNKSSFER